MASNAGEAEMLSLSVRTPGTVSVERDSGDQTDVSSRMAFAGMYRMKAIDAKSRLKAGESQAEVNSSVVPVSETVRATPSSTPCMLLALKVITSRGSDSRKEHAYGATTHEMSRMCSGGYSTGTNGCIVMFTRIVKPICTGLKMELRLMSGSSYHDGDAHFC